MRRAHRARLFTVAAWLSVAAWAPHAGAQAPVSTARPAAATPAKPSVDDLFKRFAEAAKVGDWPKAYEAMQEAYSQKQTYDVLGNLGTAELQLGKARDAAEHLWRSLSNFPVVGKPEAKKVTEDFFAKAAAQVGTIRLKVSPASARVMVGNRVYTADDYRERVFVEAGDVMVSAGDVAGYVSQQQKVHVDKGKTMDVELALKSADGAPSASGTASVAPTAAPTGEGPSLPLVIAGGAVTLASLGVGIGLLVASGDKAGEAKRLQAELLAAQGPKACAPPTPSLECNKHVDAARTSDMLGNIGGSLLIVGGVAAAATTVYFLVARPRATKTAVQPGFVVAPSGAVLSVQGSF